MTEGGAESGDLLYWRGRAEALAAANQALRERLLRLARILPPEYLPAVDGAALDLAPGDLFEGWDETAAPIPSDVVTELSLLWARLSPREGP